MNREECSTLLKNKILVVEDNSAIRQLVVLRLKELGYEVFEAETGLSAFRQARATSPDLILMDLGMPVIGGDALIQTQVDFLQVRAARHPIKQR